jgi:hypothetical protein
MIKEAKDREEYWKHYKIPINNIPPSTRQPLYQRLLEKEQQRREEVKRMSIAMTKQKERPFSFHHRDLERA